MGTLAPLVRGKVCREKGSCEWAGHAMAGNSSVGCSPTPLLWYATKGSVRSCQGQFAGRPSGECTAGPDLQRAGYAGQGRLCSRRENRVK